MSKIVVLGDTHFGCRNDSAIFSDYFEEFFRNVFFPYIDQHQIKTIIQLGDLFDRRKYINYVSLASCESYFFKELEKRDVKIIYLVGNHDTYYKNTLAVNSIELLVKNKYKNPTVVVTEPQEVEVEGVNVLCIPWICDENREQVVQAVNSSRSQILFGHLEIAGFEMYSGLLCEEGEKVELFEKFDTVITGHFHHRSHSRNIWYTGTPYEMTWSDFMDEKGFYTFDLHTRELEFINNPYKMFFKVFYHERTDELLNTDYSHLKDKYVKVIIESRDNPAVFDTFIDKLEKAGVADLLVVEDHLYLNLTKDDDIISEAEDTLTILRKSVANIEGCGLETKVRVESTLQRLYHDALTME